MANKLTEDDVNAFRVKLDAWAGSLDDTDHAILEMILARAFTDEPEVEGFQTGQSRLSADHIVHKHLAGVKYEDNLRSPGISVGFPMSSLVGAVWRASPGNR